LIIKLSCRSFCARCESGACTSRHVGGCYRPVSQSEEAHACRCGVAWALSYKAELNDKFKTTFKGSIF